MLKGGVDNMLYGLLLLLDVCTVFSAPEPKKTVWLLCLTINLQTLCRVHYNATRCALNRNTTKVC